MPEPVEDTHLHKIANAVAELGKGLKSISFYPPGHPSLVQAVQRILSLLEAIPLPEKGLELAVSRNALLHDGKPLPAANKAILDLNRELFLRRVARIFLLPGLKHEEVIAFLSVLNRDPDQVQEEGGVEKLLPREKVFHIGANHVDYEALTEMLKKEQAREDHPPLDEEAVVAVEEEGTVPEPKTPEEITLEGLLKRLERETSPPSYRDLVMNVARILFTERADRKIEYTAMAFSILAEHAERPPGMNAEISELARRGIREMGGDEMVGHYLRLLRDRSRQGRREVELILALLEERSVKPLLAALADEEDLLVRKSIVEIVIRIGRPAIPAILENLNDSRWYTVRNMVTILGSMGMPDLTPHVAGVLNHPDLRVKKEAIKALSKLSHPFAISALGELCFFPEESVALTATSALSGKKEPEAVLALYRRAVRKKVLYPEYRLAHEAIESLRIVGTDEALTALDEIIRMKAFWTTRRLREMKLHALRSIGKIDSDRSRELLQSWRAGSDRHLRAEAERLLKRAER